MLSAELEQAIRHALDDATARGHEFSGLEHLLLALLGDEKTVDVIKHCGGTPKRIQDKLGLSHRHEYVQFALRLGLLHA